jgi:phage repressor protein C with HTH and peptisase S24 domain
MKSDASYNHSMDFSPDQRRRALEWFMKNAHLNPTKWEKASGVGDGTLRKFLGGKKGEGTLTDRTYARLQRGAEELLNRPVTLSELQNDGPDHNPETGSLSTGGHANITERQRIVQIPSPPPTEKQEKDPGVPVLGTSIAGSNGDFQMNNGEIGRVRETPVGLRGKRDVFGVWVEGDSMKPWKRPGQLVLLDPHKRPQNGDHVVVELKATPPDEDHPALLKLLVARAGSKVRLRQYNPDRTFEVDARKIHKLHRVMELEEIIGA